MEYRKERQFTTQISETHNPKQLYPQTSPHHPQFRDGARDPKSKEDLKRQMYMKISQKPDPTTVEALLQEEERLWES